MNKVTQGEFRKIKYMLKLSDNVPIIASLARRSVKTIMQAKHSADFEAYTQQNKAQHPKTKYSLADEVKKLHRMVFYAPSVPYVSKSARRCVQELIEYYEKENQ